MSHPQIRTKLNTSTTTGEKKQKNTSKLNLVPCPPRRLSSKWHPSLLRTNQNEKYSQPTQRSTSAERVRETRAFYSSWHRDMVTKSKEKLLYTSITKSLRTPDTKITTENNNGSKKFLLDRRAVSESRFILKDKVANEDTKSKPRSTSADGKIYISKQIFKTKNKSAKFLPDNLPISSQRRVTSTKQNSAIFPKRHYGSLERPSTALDIKLPLSRSAETSPTRVVDTEKWPSCTDSRGGLVKHTVSSLNKIKGVQKSKHEIKPSSNIKEENVKESRHASCLTSKFSSSFPSKKLPIQKRDTSLQGGKSTSKVKENKKCLEQSESFDTTHSNETGYCSMLDLSSSLTAEQKSSSLLVSKPYKHKDSKNQTHTHTSTENKISGTRPATLPRRSEPRAHSAPGLRIRSSLFHERLEKWQQIGNGKMLNKSTSHISSRSSSPLRSLELIKRVSNSFKNIPKEVNFQEIPITRSLSLEVLGPSPYPDPKQYKEYILELKNAVSKNTRISQLCHLYDSLEKIHKLERSVSTAELFVSNKRKCNTIDYDAWKDFKNNKQNVMEYNILTKQLDEAKKEREFFYNLNPKKQWSGDCRLRGKEKLVSELKKEFDSRAKEAFSTQLRREKSESEKDTYRGFWRGSSVKDISKTISSTTKVRSKRGSSLSLTREDSAFRPKGLWTSLSLEQINALREQLTEIYGSMQSIKSWRQKREKMKGSEDGKDNKQTNNIRSRSLDKNSKISVSFDASRTNFAETSKLINETLANIEQKPLSKSNLEKFNYQNSNESKCLKKVDKMEEERKRLSKQLSIELQEKVAEQKDYQDKFLVSLPDRPSSLSPESLSRSSPRTCYSLDVSDASEPTSLPSSFGDNFLLVVRKPKRSNSLTKDECSNDESSDSDASVRTVIHKDVAKKVKFFEKKARKSSKGSHLNVDSSEIPHYATLPIRHKKRQKNKQMIFESDYLPVRSASSVTLSRQQNSHDDSQDKPSLNGNFKNNHLNKEPSFDTSYSRSYLLHVKTGDVDKLKERYETTDDLRKRSKSLPNIGGTLSSRMTPNDRTFIREHEMGDVKYTKAKYEKLRHTKVTSDRWQRPKDEYIPKSKIANTLYTLASRSSYFNEPLTMERISRRDSVEKSRLKRVYTGVVETVVDKFESEKLDHAQNQMLTSFPSFLDFGRLSPLIPPRPPLPNIVPQKPQRSISFSPRHMPKTISLISPIKTSTPVSSPQQDLEKNAYNYIIERQSNFSSINDTKPYNIAALTPYNASAHIPKFRYTPPDSYGASKWTQSLERPRKLVRNLSNKGEFVRRTQSFSPPRGASSLKYGLSRSMSPPQSYSSGYKMSVEMNPKQYSSAFYNSQIRPPPIPPPPILDNDNSELKLSKQEENLYQKASFLTRPSAHSTTPLYNHWKKPRLKSPPPLPSDRESLEKAQTAFRDMKNKITSYAKISNQITESLNKSETPKRVPAILGNYPNYHTYPLRGEINRRHARSAPQSFKVKHFSKDYGGSVPQQNSSIGRESSLKSVTWKGAFFIYIFIP